jgi:hypothetical protein
MCFMSRSFFKMLNDKRLEGETRLRITGMSLCRYQRDRETSYASRIPSQASKDISIPAARYDWAVRVWASSEHN